MALTTNPIHIAKEGMLRNGIVATGKQRVAAQQSHEDEIAGMQKAVLLETLERIFGAGGLKSATACQAKCSV